jgi:hypothetical protein
MAVMTTMVACFNQEVELKKETVRKDTRALMLGPQMVNGRTTRKTYVKSPVGYGPDLGGIGCRFEGCDGSEVCR